MGGGNGQKSKTARERNMEKQKAAAKGKLLCSSGSLDTLVDLVFFVIFLSKIIKSSSQVVELTESLSFNRPKNESKDLKCLFFLKSSEN